MLGGSPMMNAAIFPPPFSGQMYPTAQFPSQPVVRQNPSLVRPAATVSNQTNAPAPRPLVARAKGLDDAPLPATPAPLSMPTPEQLGVGRAKPSLGDGAGWTDARRRLDRLGATCFQLEKLSPNGYRFTCLLPTNQPGRHHHVEAVAATESEAVRLTLEKSEEWAGGR
jgi:hypothetical protein